MKNKSMKKDLKKRMSCLYYPEGSTNSRRKYKQSSKSSEEHVDDLSQPLGRSSLELTKMLPALSANNLDIIKKSIPNPCLRSRFLWKPGMTLKLQKMTLKKSKLTWL